MREQPVEDRITNFEEVPLGYSEEEAISEAKRCLQCSHSPCTEKCPVKIDVTKFVNEISKGDFKEAFYTLKKSCPIPSIAGRVCPQENQCEGACVLGKSGKSINIGKLESFIGDWAIKNNIIIPFSKVENSKKVAIIGSGPTGISCAVDLRKLGYGVTMFEALHKAGGVLQYGIPEFRLPKKIVDTELHYLEEIGVEIRLNTIIGQHIDFREVLNEYDAIYVATGAGAPKFLNLDGEELNGVYSANEFLIRTNLMKSYKFPEESDTPIIVGKKVAVIGAGNVAMDAARSALRYGAETHIIYRRSKNEAPARFEEFEHAIQEGVIFHELQNPVRLNGENGWIKSITCLKMELGSPDESGRRRPIPIEGSEFTEEYDTVIEAIGTSPNRLFLERAEGLEVNRWGGINVNDNLQSSIENVFAGGDSISGGATVIQALGEGRKAAKKIHIYLQNKRRNDNNWTIQEALQIGAKMELESYNLYKNAAKEAKYPGAKKLLSKLAEDEKRHLADFLSALKDPKYLQKIYLHEKIRDLKISDKLIKIPLNSHLTCQQVLVFAAQREKATHDFFEKMAHKYEDTELGKMFNTLALEELHHKYLLEKEYDEIFLYDM
jgi:glutamate synthase (NADPH/NADH) small chain